MCTYCNNTNTIIFQSLLLHCVMVTCQIINLEKVSFLPETGLPIILEYRNTQTEIQVLINYSTFFFFLGPGIQDQLCLPDCCQQAYSELLSNTEKRSKILHGFLILNNLLIQIGFFLQMFVFFAVRQTIWSCGWLY